MWMWRSLLFLDRHLNIEMYLSRSLGFTTRGRFEEGRVKRAVLFEDLKGEKEAASNVPKKNCTGVGNRGLLEGGAVKEGF